MAARVVVAAAETALELVFFFLHSHCTQNLSLTFRCSGAATAAAAGSRLNQLCCRLRRPATARGAPGAPLLPAAPSPPGWLAAAVVVAPSPE